MLLLLVACIMQCSTFSVYARANTIGNEMGGRIVISQCVDNILKL